MLDIDLGGEIKFMAMNPKTGSAKGVNDDGSSPNDDDIQHGYLLVSEEDPTEFENRIEGLMDSGWSLVGGPFYANDQFCQALTIIKS